MVAAVSDRIPRVPPYSGGIRLAAPLPVRDFHPLRPDFPDGSGSWPLGIWTLLQPRSRRNARGLGSSPFARHYSGNRYFFLLLQVLRCFSSLRTPRSRDLSTAFSRAGSPIRTPPDHFLFADPRGFSQLTTSFLASGSLGIPRSLFSSFSYSLGESYAPLRSTSLPEGQPASAHALCLLKL